MTEISPGVNKFTKHEITAHLSQTFQINDGNSRSSKLTSSLANSSKSNDIIIFDRNDTDSNIKIIENKVIDADKFILTIKDSISSRTGKRVMQEDHKSKALRKQSVKNVE